MEELVFTPAGLLDLLSQIDELSDVNIGLTETLSGDLELRVGDNTYIISADHATDVPADDDIISDISDINDDAYSEMESSGQVSLDQPIESGIIKELAKTLLVGGIARLTAKYLSK